MSIKTKNAGAYADIVGVFHKRAGAYEAVQGVYAKAGGVYGRVDEVPAIGYRAFELQIEAWTHEGGAVGTTGYARVAELQILVGATKYPTVNMTGASAPSPLVASATSELGGSPAWYAFDGTVSDGTRWISNASGTQKLRIDLGSGASISPTSIKIAPDSGAPGSRICKFKFVGSTTGAFAGEEDVLLNVDLGDALTGWEALTLREFTIP